MRPPFYVRQLRIDLDDWIKKGWVPEASRDQILDSVGARGGIGFTGMIGILGVLLIGAGAMSFVAANWEQMGKAARLILLFGSMWLSYGLAANFLSTRPVLGQAFVLLGVLLFGANIMLIAQTYHINSHYPDGVLMWGLGALAAAALIPSRASLALALVLGALWTWQEVMEFSVTLHWQFLVYWAAATGLAAWLNWRPGIQLSALALIFWAVISVRGLQELLGWRDIEMPLIYFFVPFVLWAWAVSADGRGRANALTIEHYAFFVWLIAYCLMHVFGDVSDSDKPATTSWLAFAAIGTAASAGLAAYGLSRNALSPIDLMGTIFTAVTAVGMILAAPSVPYSELRVLALIAILIVIIWSIFRGTKAEDRFTINLSVAAFGAWVLYAYFIGFAGFMDQALFFLIGGILLLALSFGLESFRRRLVAAPGASEVKKS